MPPRERMRATAPVVRHRDKRPNRQARIRTDLPKAVHEFLEAGPGDRVVFEEGSTFVAERAAARGRYCVVYLERAPAAAAVRPQEEASEQPAAPPRLTETIQETINRLRNERPM